MILENLIFALIGAGLLFGLRNDVNEWGLGRNPWVLALLILAAGLFTHHNPDLLWWQALGAVSLTGVLWTGAHGPTLQPPWQLCSTTPDLIETALMDVFGKAPGDVMGWPMWLLYHFIRYVAPCAGIAWFLQEPAFYMVGVLIVAGYWPLAYEIVRHQKWNGERTKYIGAALAGFVFYGAA